MCAYMGRRISAVALILSASMAIFLWVLSGSHFKVCLPPEPAQLDKYVRTIGSLDQVVDLGIKLSTTLAGLGAALLIGLRKGMTLTGPVKFFVLLSTILFVQSALYAIWWRTGIAELWLNDCPPLVAESRLQYRFNAHFYLFVAGLLSLGFVVVSSFFADQNPESNGEFS